MDFVGGSSDEATTVLKYRPVPKAPLALAFFKATFFFCFFSRV